MTKREVPHEVTLVAFKGLEIIDIVETSRHFMPRFVKRFMRHDHADGLLITAPKTPIRSLKPTIKLPEYE